MKKVDVVVLGGGPGGYTAAIRCAQYGKKTVLIEKDKLGGTCLNRGCIPTKALLHNAQVYKTVIDAVNYGVTVSNVKFDYLKFAEKKNSVTAKLYDGIKCLLNGVGVEVIYGEGVLMDERTISVNGEYARAENIILATGSTPAKPGIDGIELAGVLNSDEILELAECPESLIIIGGGVIGMEFAALFNMLGVKVTVIEMLPSILNGMDADIVKTMNRLAGKNGIDIITDAKVARLIDKDGIRCVYEKNGVTSEAAGAQCLIAAGRRPQTQGIGLDAAGVKMENGYVAVDSRQRTNIPGIFAIGDVTGKVQLAHAASAQGLVAAANIVGKVTHMRYDVIPACIYTSPEIATVGMTEERAMASGRSIKTGYFPVSANGKSMVSGGKDGFVKLITEAATGEILGAHIVASHATELIAEICAVMRSEGTVDELIDTIHPHPTESEMIVEAANDVKGMSCNKA